MKEQQRRIQSEEAAAQALEAGRRMLRETQQAAQQVERELRDRLAEQAVELVQVRATLQARSEQIVSLEARLVDERAAHKAAQGLWANALAARKSSAARAPGSKASVRKKPD